MKYLQEREQFISDFFGESCCPKEELKLDEVNESIAECSAMLDHSITTNNKQEIAAWRRMLQQAKLQKRSLLNT